MDRLTHLYRQIILDHYKNPRHKGVPNDDAYRVVHLKNPTCGDDITLAVKHDGHVVEDVRHEGSGCSICCSSASVLADLMRGQEISQAHRLIQQYNAMLHGEAFDEAALKEAAAYQGVKQFPARYKCATIAWQAFEAALKEEGE